MIRKYISVTNKINKLMNKISIQEIIIGCSKKQPKYQRLFVERYAGFLYAICIRYMGNKDDAKDQLQISLFKILEKINTYNQDKGRIESWISTIAINTCLSELRKNKLHIMPISDEINNSSFVEASIIDEMKTKDILALVESLPDIYREIFNLIEIDGYKHADAAKLLGIKEASSRSRLARSKEMLRIKLAKLKKKEGWISLA